MPVKDDLKEFLLQILTVEAGDLEEYLSFWQPFTAPKKTVLTAPGEVEKYLYFVIEGLQKSYYMHQNKANIMFFAYPPSFSGVMESFFTQSPSRYYLETITDSQFLRIPFSRHEAILNESHMLNSLFRKLTEKLLSGVIERHHELLTFNAETRFRTFAQRSPHLFNLVSQKDLAAYLRIDPTNFSKLMNRIGL